MTWIKIYFGSNYGLNITSELDEGTCVDDSYAGRSGRKNMRKSRRKPFIAIGAGVILLAILFFVLTGDGLWEGREGSTNSVIEKKKVVFLTKSMDSSFWQSAYAGAGAAKCGI